MDSQRFTILGRLPGLNEYTRMNRANARAANRMKQAAQEQLGWAIRSAKLKPAQGPVILCYTWFERDRRRDLDNVAMGQKFVQDALVACGVLAGDGWAHVTGFAHEFYVDKRNPRVEVTIEEVEAI